MINHKPPKEAVRMWLKCPNCQWTMFTYRIKSKDYRCIHCGALFIADYDKGRVKLTQPPIFNHKKKR